MQDKSAEEILSVHIWKSMKQYSTQQNASINKQLEEANKKAEQIEHLIAIRAIDNIEGVNLIKEYSKQQLETLLKNILKHEREDYTMDGLRVSHIPIIDIQNEFRKLGVTVDDKINF